MPPVCSLPQVIAPQLPSIRQPKTTIFWQGVGCGCQNIEFRSVMPWISTFGHLYGSTKADRMLCPEPGTTRCAGGTPSAMRSSRNARSLPLIPG
jgi:hypothetical protein